MLSVRAKTIPGLARLATLPSVYQLFRKPYPEIPPHQSPSETLLGESRRLFQIFPQTPVLPSDASEPRRPLARETGKPFGSGFPSLRLDLGFHEPFGLLRSSCLAKRHPPTEA